MSDVCVCKDQATGPMEKVCLLCHRAQADADICGDMFELRGLPAHAYCLHFASGLDYTRVEGTHWATFRCSEIRRTVERAVQKDCCICGHNGATITCSRRACERSYHLPCAVRGKCVTQYTQKRRAFCSDHSPRQTVQAVPEKGTCCIICLEALDDEHLSFCTLVCPTCQHAWFHRRCVQGQAVRAGSSCFQCPLCRNKEAFQREMVRVGIRVPNRPPAWESLQEYAALLERHGRCDAAECLCPGGREQAEEEGPWQLLLCSSCAAEGTHRGCSHLGTSAESWECEGCAGPGAASSPTEEVTGPSSPGQAAPEAPCSSPPLQGSGRSSPPGPMRLRETTRAQHRAQGPYHRPGRCRQRGRAPAAPSTGRTPSPALPEPSCASLSPATARSTTAHPPASTSPAPDGGSPASGPGPVRVRERSRSRRQAQQPYGQRGRRRRR